MASQKDCTLIIVGKTGSGKSSLGNSLLCHNGPGKPPFEAKMWPSSVTTKCKRKTDLLKDGTLLSIVDTPGLFDTSFSIEETKKEISKSVALCAPGPHAIIIVLRIGRFTQEEVESVDTLMNMFGTKSINYFIVVFTGKDQLGGCNLDEFVQHSPKYLTDFLKECNSRYVGIANDPSSPTRDRDVQDVMKLIYKTMDQNGNQNYSQEAFAEAERVIQAEIERKQQELIEEEIKERNKRLEQDEIERQERFEEEERERQYRLENEERERMRKQKLEKERIENKRRRFEKEERERQERLGQEERERLERIKQEERERQNRLDKEERDRRRRHKLEEERVEKQRQRFEREERERQHRIQQEEMSRLFSSLLDPDSGSGSSSDSDSDNEDRQVTCSVQ